MTNQGAAAAPPAGALDGVPSVPPRHSTLQQEGLPGLVQLVAPGLQAVAHVGLELKNTGTGASCASVFPAHVNSNTKVSARVKPVRWAMLRRREGVLQLTAGSALPDEGASSAPAVSVHARPVQHGSFVRPHNAKAKRLRKGEQVGRFGAWVLPNLPALLADRC